MKNQNELANMLKQVEYNMNDPYFVGEADNDTAKILLQVEQEAIKDWYDITQSMMQLFFRIKEDGFLDASDDPEVQKQAKKHKDRFREIKKRFGWSKAKKEKDIKENEDLLNPDSPYRILSEVYGIRNMITQRNEKRMKRISKDLENYFGNTEENEIQPLCLNESSDIYSLYLESEENNKQAESAVKEIPVLNKRKQEIKNRLNEVPYLKNHYPDIIEDIITKSIALGYTAGINANTTETLRRMNGSNNSSEA